MTLEYVLKEGENGLLSVYDVSGRMVKKQTLSSNDSKAEVNATNLNAGAYYYLINVDDKKVKAEKLIIIK